MAGGRNGTGSDDSGDIDLMGWDTVFALSLAALNDSIVAQKTTPPTFSGTDPVGGAAVTGSWGPWSVLGGEGDGILLKCPVTTGTLTMPGMPATNLDGGYVEVMITLASNPGTAAPDPSAKPGTGKAIAFQANGNTSDPFQTPKVQPVQTGQFPNVTGYAVYGLVAAFQAYFNANIAAFDAVFSAVILEEEAVDAGKQWLKPQVSLYAMATAGSQAAGTQQDAYFGVLSLTSPPNGPLPQQNFDERMFDFFRSTDTPTNSVFAISAPLAMQYIVLQAAKMCVKNAQLSDFKLTNNGITVTNVNALEWGDFQFSKDDTQTVTPVIQPGDFQLTLDGTNFHLSISQAAFTTPDGTTDVKLSADQFFTFGVAKLSNGNYYFTPGKGLGTNSIRADCTANKGFEIAMIIESIATSVAFAFIGAGIGEALGDALSTSTSSASEGLIEGSESALQDSIEDLGEEGQQTLEDGSMSDATDSIANDGENTQGKSGIFANKFKVFGGMLGGLFGIPVGLLPQIMTMIYNDKITEGNVPTVDDFAANFTGAVQWPQVKNWQVTGGTFASSFLLAGSAT